MTRVAFITHGRPGQVGDGVERLMGVARDAGVDTAPFGVTTRTDGKKQVTLDGHPLYTYAGDVAPGDVNGDGIGGVWHLARPLRP